MNRPPPFRGPVPGPSGAGTLPRGRGGGRRPDPVGLDTGIAGLKRVFTEVDWSLSFICFLTYVVIVITYRFTGASFAILGAVGGLILEKDRRRFPYWLAWFGCFLLWGAVCYTQSRFASVAWNDGVVEYGKVFLICLVAANVLTNGPRLRFFLIFFLFLYATHPIRGALFNMFIYGYSLENRAIWNGMWANPNDMAALTFLPLGIAAGLLKDRSDLIRKAALASVAVMPFVILLTQSRGGYAALALFAALTVLANLKKIRALVIIGVMGLGAVLLAPEGTFDRFTDFATAVEAGDVTDANDSNSARQRLEIWRIARRIIAIHPVFGVGLAAYNYEHQQYAFFSAETEIGFGSRDTHSTYLRVTAETGYPGLAIFVMPFILAVARSRRIRRRYGRQFPDKAENVKYLEAALIALAITAIFGSYAHTVVIWLHLGLLCILTEDLRHAATQAARGAIRRGPLTAGRPLPQRPVGATR